MSKYVKRMMIDTLRCFALKSPDFIVVDVSRIKGHAINRVRLDFSEKGLRLFGINNSLASRVLESLASVELSGVLSGPSSLVFGTPDIVELSKLVVSCADTNKSMVIRGGVVEGRVLCEAGVKLLSKSQGRLELLSQFSATLNSQASRFARSISSVGDLLLIQMSSLCDQ